MEQYLRFLRTIRNEGRVKHDRTGVGTVSTFGTQMRFDLVKGFPLVTTKRVHLKSVIHELLWFLRGDTNIKYLKDNGVSIWDEWADKDGELGPVYGKQWRSWVGADGVVIDQIAKVVESLKNNPNSRRHIVSAWNPSDVDNMALPPCHTLFQFNVRDATFSERYTAHSGTKYQHGQMGADDIIALSNKMDEDGVPRKLLDCLLYQRSADAFLGVPFNIASYSLLTMMMAQVCGMLPGEFIWIGGDCHIYLNHFEQIKEQLSRSPKDLPRMVINPEVKDIFAFTYDDFTLEWYDPHPVIKAEVAV